MPARRRKLAVAATLGTAPLALTALAAAPAAAHGSMGDPVSRVSQCYAEGPESPKSDACKAAVATETPAASASAPSEQQIEDGADKSTIEHHGHGDDDASTSAEPSTEPTAEAVAANEPKAAGATENLAETGGDGSTPYLAVGGAAALALGAAVLFASVRRRATGGGSE
ncbi:lytic polysaccharide monooxygenase [Streptomyces sp. NPDC002088]|uniref:lytic polysaccharide monooxygenase n=1 Tax=Streptomyces sp. NPDC002088 TaxID=3154665 RepID=UPI00332065F3